jgi:hypothetical protein
MATGRGDMHVGGQPTSDGGQRARPVCERRVAPATVGTNVTASANNSRGACFGPGSQPGLGVRVRDRTAAGRRGVPAMSRARAHVPGIEQFRLAWFDQVYLQISQQKCSKV